MVYKEDIIKIIDLTLKNYNLKNHRDRFTSYTCETIKGGKVTIEVLELTSKPTFIKKLKEAKSTVEDTAKWRVDEPSIEDLENTRIFQTWNGCVFAVKSDGDIVNVCGKMGDEGYSLDNMEAVMHYAVNECGGDRLDSFDGNWSFYRKCGFEPREWIGFDESFGEQIGWVKGRDRAEPVIFMEYTGNKKKLKKEDIKKEKDDFYFNPKTRVKETTMDEARPDEEIPWDVAYRKRNEHMNK